MKGLVLSSILTVYALHFGVAKAQDPSGDANCAGHPCMTTYHSNNNRNGVNSRETYLVANSFPSGFGTSPASVSVDGMVYAQPLYMYGVSWAGSSNCAAGATNMVYVATENNTLYAIQADSPFNICKSVTLNDSGADTAISVGALPLAGTPAVACNNLTGSSTYGTIGVTGTPAIDPNNNVLFVASAHQSVNTPYTYTQRLNAVDITTLTIIQTLDLPTYINAAAPSGYPTFYALNESQRSGLTLAKISTTGVNIYIAWGTFCDANISSGGSFGLVSEFDYSYSTSSFSTAVESFYPEGTNTNLVYTTPAPAGVWMSGGAPAADSSGNVYVAVGNGKFEGVNTPLNFGNSIVKLGGSTFGEEDFYTPNVWSILNFGTTGTNKASCGGTCQVALPTGDWDLGSGGAVLLTTSSATQYGELVAGGKEGMFYVTYYCSSSTCPSTSWNALMGGLDGPTGYNTNSASNYKTQACTQGTSMSPSPGSLAQCFYGVPVQATKAESGERATPAFWSPSGSNPYLYTVGTSDILKAYVFNSTGSNAGTFTTPAGATGNPPSGSGTKFGYPGATPSVSWDGTHTNTAIVWVLDTSAWSKGSSNQAVLTAYVAQPSGSSLNQIWTTYGKTGAPGATKFMVATVANGKVYVGGQRVGGCGSTCTGLLTIYY